MGYKILATSDLHLGKSSKGVKAGVSETATKVTWLSMVELAISDNVDAIIIAGDIIDRDDHYYEAIGQLQSGFDRLNNANVEVLIVAGNHDFDVTTEIMQDGRFSNVTLLGANGNWEKVTLEKEEIKIQFIGWSFPSLHYTKDPSAKIPQLNIDTQYPTIGILHGEVGNDESPYAPIQLSNLIDTPANAWILGHIHKPGKLNDDPIIYYTGSPHALSAKEKGMHGPLILNVTSPQEIEADFLPLSPIRYESLDIDVSGANDENDFRSRITLKILEETRQLTNELDKVQYLTWDIILSGYHEKIREVEMWVSGITDTEVGNVNDTSIHVRKVNNEIQPAVSNLKDIAKQTSPIGRIAETIISIEKGEKTKFLDELIIQWKKMAFSVSNSNAYQPIRISTPDNVLLDDEDAKKYILKECNRLLSELINQQQQ